VASGKRAAARGHCCGPRCVKNPVKKVYVNYGASPGETIVPQHSPLQYDLFTTPAALTCIKGVGGPAGAG
jgi:hypothetical protein